MSALGILNLIPCKDIGTISIVNGFEALYKNDNFRISDLSLITQTLMSAFG